MIEKFKTLFFVKSSLVSLYLALTFPIPFISSEKLRIFAIIAFVFGLILIIKNNPKINVKIENIFKFSFEINGMGIVSAKYKEIKELLTKKRVLNFSIIWLKFF